MPAWARVSAATLPDSPPPMISTSVRAFLESIRMSRLVVRLVHHYCEPARVRVPPDDLVRLLGLGQRERPRDDRADPPLRDEVEHAHDLGRAHVTRGVDLDRARLQRA